jgi:hypothetical protein
MSYYTGDFYRGGRYPMKGDPGFFSFLGGLAKKAAGFIPGVGPAVSGVLEGISHGGAAKAGKMAIEKAGAIVRRHPVLSAAGAAGIIGGGAGVGAGELLARHGMKGVRGGRRHRRMRVTNPKALRRAIRRTHGFAKLAMRTIHIVHPKKKGRFGGFKRRRKAA